jgi:hypothetical protein
MNDNYHQQFPIDGFPGSENEGITFTSGDLLDHPIYIEQQPQRKWQIDRAREFLDAFERGRAKRQRKLAEILKHRHRDNTVLAMTLNSGFSTLLLNWVESCDRNNIEVRSWALIAALDEDTATMCEQLGLSVFCPGPDYGSHVAGPVREYGDDQFGDLMFPKNAIVQDLLELGFDVLFQDVDLVWLKDPARFLMDPGRRMLDAQFMYDGQNNLFAPLFVNSGFFYLRNTPHCRKFWQLVYDNFDKVYPYSSQQRVVNMVLVHRYFRGLKLDVLAEADFANGHLFSNDDVNGLPPDPYVIHCSWTSNLAHKMKKYHLANLWYL